MIKRLATTVSYVTCIPVIAKPGAKFDSFSENDLVGLAQYLPVAGLLIGSLLCLIAWLLGLIQANAVLSSTLLAVSWLCLTGGIHFDGLMDTADGIFSHQPVERMLEIMTDSRVGNYGVLTGLVTLLVKIACLASLPHSYLFTALLLSPSWSRWCESFAIGRFSYVKKAGMGKVWHDTMKFPQDLVKGAILPILATACAAIMQPLPSLAVALTTIFAGLLVSFALAKKFGGHTGDTYGAVVELAEVGGLLILALLFGH